MKIPDPADEVSASVAPARELVGFGTRETPMSELSGIALRGAVAVEVMGRTGPQKHDIHECDDSFYSYCRVCGGDNAGWDLEQTECHGHPAYEESIADAWLVVEKMRAEHIGLQLNSTPGEWRARFFTVESTVRWYEESQDGALYCFDKSLPTAICRAALAAVRAQ
jgi:hypothetical protein